MYSARREGSELGQLRDGVCLMYGARRGEGRCTRVWGTGATQGALTSRRPAGVTPPVQTIPWQPYQGKITARGRSAPPPRPSLPRFLAPPHHP